MDPISMITTGISLFQALQGSGDAGKQGGRANAAHLQPNVMVLVLPQDSGDEAAQAEAPRTLSQIMHDAQILSDAMAGRAHHCEDTFVPSWHDEDEDDCEGATSGGIGGHLPSAVNGGIGGELPQGHVQCALGAELPGASDPFAAIAEAERNGGGKKLTRALDSYIHIMARQAEAQKRMSGDPLVTA